MSEERFARIEARLDSLNQGQDNLRAGQDSLRVGQDSLRVGQDELRRHMGVLHEEVLDRIQALVFDPEPLRREFKAGISELREELVLRIEPLEAAARRKREH